METKDGAIMAILIMTITLFLSCDRNDEIPITTWKTTGVHRIEITFSDTLKWNGVCAFVAGYSSIAGLPLFENGIQINDSTERYVEMRLRNYNVYTGKNCNGMIAGIRAFPRTPEAKPLTIMFKGYVNDVLTNTEIVEFAPEIQVKEIKFRTEVQTGHTQ